ncbi:MAG: thiamine phosphate synthase [Nitrospinae bacterium CG11_big_fil_rev_8_21_14_0_20_56_8]|nr:MAG: thiamine phosphate synthase [Nitrospinae bacterium CG11_big_fil_rev_8_21_14_0_20_56_8]
MKGYGNPESQVENPPDPHPLENFRLYIITDRHLLPEQQFLPAVESALRGGARAIQVREKDLSPADLLALARRLRELTRTYGARLLINDRADIAVMAEADGVHLTEASAPAGEVRKRFPGLLIGVSTHSQEKAREAEEQGADFITFGPVFDTPSKREYGPPLGLERLREVARCVRLPVLGLGGIKKTQAASVREQGAFGVALISGIWNSLDIQQETFEYLRILSEVTHS